MNARSLLVLTVVLLAASGCGDDGPAASTTGSPDATSGGAGGQGRGAAVAALVKEDLKVGDGKVQGIKVGDLTVEEGDVVAVLYEGRLADGTVFDSNMAKGKDPFVFTVGQGEVIKGWDQGLLGMKVGGERKLSIPWTLAYGEQGAGGGAIPPRSDLFFTVKVLDVIKPGQESVFDVHDVKKGTGRAVKKGDTVVIESTGVLVNGKQFYTTVGKKPVTFKVGADEAITGVDEGVVGMQVGGVRKLRIPPAIGYGAGQGNGIPASSTLVYTIRLLRIQ